MGKWKGILGAITKGGNEDSKPQKPIGNSYGNTNPTGYFGMKVWRREKTAWNKRQEAREKESGVVGDYNGQPYWVPSNHKDKEEYK